MGFLGCERIPTIEERVSWRNWRFLVRGSSETRAKGWGCQCCSEVVARKIRKERIVVMVNDFYNYYMSIKGQSLGPPIRSDLSDPFRSNSFKTLKTEEY